MLFRSPISTFSKLSQAIEFFLLLHTLPLSLGGTGGISALVGVAVGTTWAIGSAWAVSVVWKGGASLEGSIT